jgi:EAL domain-containing protein (putative c-di-GMP-specific phosphodiesterase class I)
LRHNLPEEAQHRRNPQFRLVQGERKGMEASTTTIIRTIDDVIDARAITTVFQPIVRLDSWNRKRHEVVGYEALTRGPVGTPWEAPLPLFEAAAGRDRLAELDWICRAHAYRAAMDAELPLGLTLFVNAEPLALSVPCPPDRDLVLAAARALLHWIVPT